jgi:hypothetical protein
VTRLHAAIAAVASIGGAVTVLAVVLASATPTLTSPPTPTPPPVPTAPSSIRVTSIPALLTALADDAVTEIVVADGTYRVSPASAQRSDSLWIGAKYATRTRSVLVRAETTGGVTFEGGGADGFGGLSFQDGAHDQTWQGFTFANGVATSSGVIMFGDPGTTVLPRRTDACGAFRAVDYSGVAMLERSIPTRFRHSANGVLGRDGARPAVTWGDTRCHVAAARGRRLTSGRRRSSRAGRPHGAVPLPSARGRLDVAAPRTPRAPLATRHLSRWLGRVDRWLSSPDHRVCWRPFALSAGVHAVRTCPIDPVQSTPPPVTADVVAGIAARVGRVPWVAELHDRWLGNPSTEALGGPRPWLHRRLRVRMERSIVGSADRIVFVSQSMRGLYGWRDPGRVADIRDAATDDARRVPATRSARPPGARDAT